MPIVTIVEKSELKYFYPILALKKIRAKQVSLCASIYVTDCGKKAKLVITHQSIKCIKVVE